MPYDPAWSQPEVNWQQQGSFLQPATPPALGPLEGTLIELPCINRDWLLLILGALDQLRNPSTWIPTLTDAELEDVIADADILRSAIGQALSAVLPCMPIELRLNGCVLQYSQDAGVTWVDTTNWAAGFCSCVQPCIIPAPSNPRGTPSPQLVCNYSGFLANEVLQRTCQLAYNQQIISHDVVAFAQSLLPYLEGLGFILTTAFADVAFSFFQYINDMNKANFQFAATDPLLQGLLTCAIYTAVLADGTVTAGNFPTILANIAAISYTFPEVISAVHDYVQRMGALSLASLQDYGAITDWDCSVCAGGWCHEFDFTVSAGGWVVGAPGYGTWVPGTGWVGGSIGGNEVIAIEFNGAPFTCVGMEYTCYTDNNWTGPPVYRSMRYATTSAFVRETDITSAPINPAQTFVDSGFSLSAITELALTLAADFIPSTVRITKARIRGTGPIPNGWDLSCV